VHRICLAPITQLAPDTIGAIECAITAELLERRRFGYRMIESFEIQNFRCFSALKLDDLKRVNVITGANASGKSALLEALLCAARGTPEALLATNALRNLTAGNIAAFGWGGFGSIPPQNFRALWDHLFYSAGKNGFRQTADKIQLSYLDTDHKNYAVEIKFAEPGPQSQPRVCWDSSRVYHGCGEMDDG
jgi:AAA ATPase domain